MIKILVVDDSKVEAELLKKIFEEEVDFDVIGIAKNGEEAVALNTTLKPDLITMDINMPVMDGYEATRIIMSQSPTPIVVISSKVNKGDMDMTFRALDAGALSVLAKPADVSSAEFKGQRKNMVSIMRSMAEIKVIKRRFFTKKVSNPKAILKELKPTINAQQTNYEIIGIGTSVGGPQALKTILSKLSADFPLPITIVQHMTHGFISGFVKWLDENIKLEVQEAEDNKRLEKGTVYFAPDGYHLEIVRIQDDLYARLKSAPAVSGFCPSATVLLKSIAKSCGKNAIGILLTGMGSDGAEGLLELKKVKAHTLIQDPQSAIVFGMAGVAQSLGAVDRIIALDVMAEYLNKLTQNQSVALNKS